MDVNMKKILIPLFFVLFSGKAMAIEFPIEVTEYIDDIKIDVYINKNDVTDKLK